MFSGFIHPLTTSSPHCFKKEPWMSRFRKICVKEEFVFIVRERKNASFQAPQELEFPYLQVGMGISRSHLYKSCHSARHRVKPLSASDLFTHLTHILHEITRWFKVSPEAERHHHEQDRDMLLMTIYYFVCESVCTTCCIYYMLILYSCTVTSGPVHAEF